MAILKSKDISKMAISDIEDKIKDLRIELVKEKVNISKGGKTKIREIKRTIAKLLTFISNFNRINNKKTVEEK